MRISTPLVGLGFTLGSAMIALTPLAPVTAHTPAPALRACVAEDDPGPCAWDARHFGNGRGDSYVVTRHAGEPRVTYVRHAVAHRLTAGADR